MKEFFKGLLEVLFILGFIIFIIFLFELIQP
jgi:hypothetical protein